MIRSDGKKEATKAAAVAGLTKNPDQVRAADPPSSSATTGNYHTSNSSGMHRRNSHSEKPIIEEMASVRKDWISKASCHSNEEGHYDRQQQSVNEARTFPKFSSARSQSQQQMHFPQYAQIPWRNPQFPTTKIPHNPEESSLESTSVSDRPPLTTSRDSESQQKPPSINVGDGKRKLTEKKRDSFSDAEDVSLLSRSERKRRREMKRRNDVNRGFEDLTALLIKMDPPEFKTDDEEKKGDSNAASFNRVDLIAKTVCVLERLNEENNEMLEKLKKFESETEDRAKEKVVLMFPIMVPSDRPVRAGGPVPVGAIPVPPVIPPSLLYGQPRPTIYHPTRPVVPPSLYASTPLAASHHPRYQWTRYVNVGTPQPNPTEGSQDMEEAAEDTQGVMPSDSKASQKNE